ncbi:MAG: hypothetical protein JXR03_09625 [Cyclobacteriaceae bacterium]
MRKITPILFLSLVFGCAQPKTSMESYFDLKEVLEEQVVSLAEMNARLEKVVEVAGEKESKILELDSAGWVDQFDIITEFSLTEPRLVGVFNKRMSERVESYEVKEGMKSPLKHFSISSSDSSKSISSVLFSEKTIYVDFKELTLEMKDGLIASFEVSGYQKMALKDTTKYSIKAKVLLP